MKASLPNYRQSPRKVRLVADTVRGKTVIQARDILEFLPRRAAGPLQKLLQSAVANAAPLLAEQLTVGKLTVDKGVVYRRSRPVSRGRAHPIKKRTSHLSLELKATV